MKSPNSSLWDPHMRWWRSPKSPNKSNLDEFNHTKASLYLATSSNIGRDCHCSTASRCWNSDCWVQSRVLKSRNWSVLHNKSENRSKRNSYLEKTVKSYSEFRDLERKYPSFEIPHLLWVPLGLFWRMKLIIQTGPNT